MFVDQRRFPFLADLRAQWEVIRDECLALPRETYQPWVQREMYGQGWSVYGLVAFGKRIEEALDACPHTASALTKVPHLTTAGFSRMAPGTHIKPHQGWVTTVYRAHLGLVVPEDCALRVGDETRQWSEGESLVFDDTVTHEAWNYGSSDRIVLLFDFARPGYEDMPQDELPASVASFVRRGG
ncbi:aspartyl/asparaginyl beta-hydroxylase domain-containing protein [Micromonospora chalcea]|uniref:aspartyl/asparaginyl beta-hydroxylase domain-containing protein n=1 Tax=Micromonospora TaxID=1873 RepID=UPI0004C2E682|nr:MULTISPECIES: aspartyl/asparaginyl beta-hydroxylase domain-containing protein [Micromonospora]OKJ46045.1 hydroxylase [Micromonospora sp. TSRI0369]